MDDNAHMIGALEAQTHFPELLEMVSRGNEVTIVREGLAVARMVPPRRVTTEEERRRAIEGMREIASRNRLHGLSVKDLISEGRR